MNRPSECQDCGATLSANEAKFNDGVCDDCQQERDSESDGDFQSDWGQA